MFLEVPCCSISPSDCCASCGWSGPQQGSAPGPLKSVKATQPPPVPGGQFSGDPASRRGLAMQDCRGLWPDKTAQALVPRPAGAQGLALPLPRGCGKRAWREAVGVTASLGSFCWVVFCLSAALSVPCVSLLSSYEGCSGLPPPSLSGSSIPGGQWTALGRALARFLRWGEARRTSWKKLILCNSSTRGSGLRWWRVCSVPTLFRVLLFSPSSSSSLIPIFLGFSFLSWYPRTSAKCSQQRRKLIRFAFNLLKHLGLKLKQRETKLGTDQRVSVCVCIHRENKTWGRRQSPVPLCCCIKHCD